MPRTRAHIDNDDPAGQTEHLGRRATCECGKCLPRVESNGATGRSSRYLPPSSPPTALHLSLSFLSLPLSPSLSRTRHPSSPQSSPDHPTPLPRRCCLRHRTVLCVSSEQVRNRKRRPTAHSSYLQVAFCLAASYPPTTSLGSIRTFIHIAHTALLHTDTDHTRYPTPLLVQSIHPCSFFFSPADKSPPWVPPLPTPRSSCSVAQSTRAHKADLFALSKYTDSDGRWRSISSHSSFLPVCSFLSTVSHSSFLPLL